MYNKFDFLFNFKMINFNFRTYLCHFFPHMMLTMGLHIPEELGRRGGLAVVLSPRPYCPTRHKTPFWGIVAKRWRLVPVSRKIWVWRGIWKRFHQVVRCSYMNEKKNAYKIFWITMAEMTNPHSNFANSEGSGNSRKW